MSVFIRSLAAAPKTYQRTAGFNENSVRGL
jgi:hypothetical protein